jgi:predicted AAA+ superfamily ATPase
VLDFLARQRVRLRLRLQFQTRIAGVDPMKNKIVLIVGFRGSGKTTVASNILQAQDAVFVFDPHLDDAYAWIPNTARSEK